MKNNDLRAKLRIIGAVAAKDIVDAVKSKTTLYTLLSILFVIVAYRFVPALDSNGMLPRLAVYDAGNSQLTAVLEDDTEFDTWVMSSQLALEAYLGRHDLVVMGIVLPPNFDENVTTASTITLEGYTIHWASDAQVAKAQAFFEAQLTEITGKPVRLDLAGNTVYTQKNSRGTAFLTSLAVILALLMVGLSLMPHLILEEKHTRTLDALLVSPASESEIVIGKALAGLFYALAAMIAVSIVYGHVITHRSVAAIVSLCGALFAVALGLLFGSLVETRAHLPLVTWGGMFALFVTLMVSILDDILPEIVINILNWIPTVALSKAIRVSFGRSAPLTAFGPELLLVLGWTVLLLTATTLLIRRATK